MQVTYSAGRDTLLAIGVPAAKIVTLPEGVNLRAFAPARDEQARAAVRCRLGIAQDAAVIGCFQKDGDGFGAGDRPKMIKGPDVLVDALVRVNARQPVTALLPGPARGYVVRRLAEAGVAVCAPGFMPRHDVPPLYHALDVYVSPARDEGGPAGVLEAMASGVPVVSTRAGMAVDLIDPGANGMLVDVNDAQGIADAVGDLLASADLRAALASRARTTIAAYDWPLVAASYSRELYEPLARESR